MNGVENIMEAVRAVRANSVRAVITALIIGFGIMALIGVQTSIEGLKYWMVSSLSSMGSNTFRITSSATRIRRRGGDDKFIPHPDITYREAMEFRDRFPEDVVVSLTANGPFNAQGKVGNRSTNPNLQLIGTDENYLVTTNYTIEEGRNLSPIDNQRRRNVIVIGHSLNSALFPNGGALGSRVQMSGNEYTVVGILESVGSAGTMGGDKISIIPANTLRKDFPNYAKNFSISVYTEDPENMDETIREAIGVFRMVRHLKPKETHNFAISKSDTFVNSLLENLAMLTIAAYVIALITLFSAAIGLMNIMLVSVTERTREVGIRKALGAKNGTILMQFLSEAIIICQLGAVAGIALGVLAGNAIGLALGTSFIVPWAWVAVGIVVCTMVGLVSGIYPAWKASQLDPIDSLRYE